MADNNLAVVQQVKAALEAAGVNLSGACGAWKLTNRVANVLNAGQPLDDHQRPPWGLLLKVGGNRAVPQMDGSCLDGDHASGAPGYATDYLIERGTWFGYDILGDGGGANNPQWGEPETSPDMVERNRQNFRPPVPDSAVPPPPPPPPPPSPIPDVGEILVLLAQLERDLAEARDEIAVLETKVADLEQGPSGDIKDIVKRLNALEVKKIPTGVRFYGIKGTLTYD